MNLSVITAQIISQPKLICINEQNIIYMMLALPNDKKNISFFKIYAYGNIGKLHEYNEFYKSRDIVFITGYLYIKKRINKTINKYYYPIVEFHDIQLYLKNLQ
uniref:Single-stranded DNA binding protein n=1 Tax=Antithamnionella ternifolia TaxID=207919 RepID=A0A4D6WMS5_9FLOR|nr:hypothetical protein [Antithamnionella ternifolia]